MNAKEKILKKYITLTLFCFYAKIKGPARWHKTLNLSLTFYRLIMIKLEFISYIINHKSQKHADL